MKVALVVFPESLKVLPTQQQEVLQYCRVLEGSARGLALGSGAKRFPIREFGSDMIMSLRKFKCR